MRRLVGFISIALLVSACGSTGSEDVAVPAGSAAEKLAESEMAISEATASTSTIVDGVTAECADVIDVEISGNGPYTFAVTVSSPDTGWDKYADEWRVESETGDVLGVRELTHPHVDEQPFTRSLSGVEVAPGTTVVVAARDSVEGYCGERLTVTVGG